MTKIQIQQEITNVLIQMGISPKAITEKASYYKDLGLDSLDFTEMIMEFELRLDLTINCTELDNIKTIKDTIDCIIRLKN